jgi:hypothetical protein
MHHENVNDDKNVAEISYRVAQFLIATSAGAIRIRAPGPGNSRRAALSLSKVVKRRLPLAGPRPL